VTIALRRFKPRCAEECIPLSRWFWHDTSNYAETATPSHGLARRVWLDEILEKLMARFFLGIMLYSGMLAENRLLVQNNPVNNQTWVLHVHTDP
jgi:hypothetical protein